MLSRCVIGTLAALTSLSMNPPVSAESLLRLHAAGSLRQAFIEIAERFERDTGTLVELVFGASGLLRERLAGGEPGDVFASANIAHPKALAEAGLAGPVRLFARNRLCALVSPKLSVRPDHLLAKMLDPSVKLGTSAPRHLGTSTPRAARRPVRRLRLAGLREG